ncbi:MAG TPA: two-component regulator propeller domain-containing protein [Cytophagales bacterium]|nr:two-component regulator propeller domain-containing protein [Cytophagales bacterium]
MKREKLFVFFLLFFYSLFSWSQRPELKFKHITPIEGLSHSFVRNIVQDHKGFIWIATANGLNRFDGYDITIYKNNPQDSNSIISNDVLRIFKDHKDNLWVGTNKGVQLYNKEQDNFYFFKETENGYINSIFQDSNKDIWVSGREFIYKYDRKNNKFIPLDIPVQWTVISTIHEDAKNRLWIGSAEGLWILDKQNLKAHLQKHIPFKNVTNVFLDEGKNFWFTSRSDGLLNYNIHDSTFVSYNNEIGNPNSLPGNHILSIFEDSLNRIWLGTDNHGLAIFDRKENKFYNYLNSEADNESLIFNSVYSIFSDGSNNIWLGSYGGVELVKNNKFTHIRRDILNKNSLSHSNIISFYQDRAENIWIGTDGGGLNKWDKEKDVYIHYTFDPNNPKSIGGNAVTDLVEDKNGNLWISTWGGGLNFFDKTKGEFIRYQHQSGDPKSLVNNNLFAIDIDKRGVLWISTAIGLDSFDPKTQTFAHYNIPNTGLADLIGDVVEDSEGNLWVGSFRGLYILNRETKEITPFIHNPKDTNTISNDLIYNILETRKGNLWITTSGGLNFYNKKTKKFTAYRKKDGLPSDGIYGIIEDDKGTLWLSTANGISHFNPITKEIKNFDISDGLQGNEFKIKAFLKLQTGEMLFGGANGFNIFKPNEIKENLQVPPVVITNFTIFNEPVTPGEKDSPLAKQISETSEIKLSYKQSVISFDFAALNYSSSEKNYYAYMLEGLETKWNYVGNKRTATYTNLDPGKYILRVKASNNDGVWNETGTSIKITVTPPFWATWWFRALTILIIAGSILLWIKVRINVIAKQKKILEEQVKLRTAEISIQKEELAEQTKKLFEINQELTEQKEQILFQSEHIEELYTELKDSIRAAQIIQNSILPPENFIKKHLPESFILNKPKDVVGGDFYWFDVKSGKIVIAAVDCTGHGVSGAFMSINGHHLLNQCIYPHEELTAAEILNRLNEAVIKELNRQGQGEQTLDGMDICLCVIDKASNKLQYAGANNPLYIIRENEVIQVKADKFSVGLSITGEIFKFSNNEISIQEGDTIYMFSDGYADQLGGKSGYEKFMYNRFRDLLIKINKEEMDHQLKILDENLLKWRKEVEQLDDILVIGFKVQKF